MQKIYHLFIFTLIHITVNLLYTSSFEMHYVSIARYCIEKKQQMGVQKTLVCLLYPRYLKTRKFLSPSLTLAFKK